MIKKDSGANKRAIAQMRHEVIDNSIRIENLLNRIIQTDLGLEPHYVPYVDELGNETDFEEIENINQVSRFRKFFLDKSSLEKKFEILKDILRKNKQKSVPEKFWKDAKDFREIRNTFAHTLAPKYPDKNPKKLYMFITDFDCKIKDIGDWNKLYVKHTKLFNEIHKIIFNLFHSLPIT